MRDVRQLLEQAVQERDAPPSRADRPSAAPRTPRRRRVHGARAAYASSRSPARSCGMTHPRAPAPGRARQPVAELRELERVVEVVLEPEHHLAPPAGGRPSRASRSSSDSSASASPAQPRAATCAARTRASASAPSPPGTGPSCSTSRHGQHGLGRARPAARAMSNTAASPLVTCSAGASICRSYGRARSNRIARCCGTTGGTSYLNGQFAGKYGPSRPTGAVTLPAPCAPACSPPRSRPLLLPATPAAAGDPIMPLVAGPRRHAVHGLLGRARHGDLLVRRRDPRRHRRRRQRPGAAAARAGVRAGGRRHGRRARASPARRSTAATTRARPQRRRDLGVARRVRRRRRARDADRGDPRHRARRARRRAASAPPRRRRHRGDPGAREAARHAAHGLGRQHRARPRARARRPRAPAARCSPRPPARSAPSRPQPMRPGAAVGVSYSTGDIQIGAIGTVAYTDEDRVWAFGHPFEDAGARRLFLQDAYVYRVIDNPVAIAGRRLDLQVRLARPHARDDLQRRARRRRRPHRRAAADACPSASSPTTSTRAAARSPGIRAADESRIGLPEGASPLVVRRAAGRHRGRRLAAAQRARPADRRRVRADLDRRARRAPRASATATCRRSPPTRTSSAPPTRSPRARRSDVFDALTAIDDYQGTPPRDRRGRGADRPAARRAARVPALGQAAAARAPRPDGPRPGDAAARARRRRSRAPTAMRIPREPAPRRAHAALHRHRRRHRRRRPARRDHHQRRGRRRRRRPRPAQPARARRRGSARSAATTASACARRLRPRAGVPRRRPAHLRPRHDRRVRVVRR